MVRFMSLDNLYISQGSISLSPLSRGQHKTPLQICITDMLSIILKSAQNKISSDIVMVLVVKCQQCMYSAFVVVGCVVTCSCTARGRDSVVQQWWWWGDRSSLQHCVSCTALRTTVLGCTVQYHNNSTHSTIFVQIHITLDFTMFRRP